jgi:hypothetical protein
MKKREVVPGACPRLWRSTSRLLARYARGAVSVQTNVYGPLTTNNRYNADSMSISKRTVSMPLPTARNLGRSASYFWLFLLLVAGCGRRDSQSPPATPKSNDQSADDANIKETWEALFIRGHRVGYAHSVQGPANKEGDGWLDIEQEHYLSVMRFSQPIEQRLKLSSVESADGRLRSFKSETMMGTQPVLAAGRVEGNTLVVETTMAGKTTTTRIDWPDDALGFSAVALDLVRRPMQPDEHRTLRVLQPVLNILGTIELTARDYEPTQLLTDTRELLRIDSILEVNAPPNGQNVEQTIWIDRTGETLKTRTSGGMEIESFWTDEQSAMEEFELFDFGLASTVSLAQPLDHAHQTRRAKYRVELKHGDPARIFAAGPIQQVVSTGPHTAEVTVIALQPDAHPESGAASKAEAAVNDDQPTDDDRGPNEQLQSDDPRVVKLARAAAGDETDPARLAVRLEKYVSRKVGRKDFSTALATAAEVAQSLQGDCTEHAMLLAAMARANGLASRVAVGLVYAPAEQGFAFHMWTEIYLGDRWVPFDATLGQGGIGAAHLKLAHSNLKGQGALAALLPIVNVLGQLEIELVESE